MWPMKLDMTREECRGVLRRLELESYGTVISTFRAQGCLSKEKLRILEDLRRMFHITNDRHRAEARRVANDERLNTVAEIISGPNSGQDWRREGHRTFPVLPRTVPHTALTYIANTVYEQLTRANCKLPHPVETSCDRLKKAEERVKFELVKKELSLYESGFVRDAAVVTSDPLQDIMSKSYINQEEQRPAAAKPVEKATPETVTNVATAINGEKPSENSPEPDPEHSSLCEILLNTVNRSENSESKSVDKSNKPVDRSQRKKPQPTKRAWKSKSAFPPAKQPKQGTLPKSVKQSISRVNNMHSPHLIHSYAVPFDVKTTNGSASSEPPQLQQHLTSSHVPQAGQQNTNNQGSGAMPPPAPVKSQPFATQTNNPVPNSSNTPSAIYAHQQGILPSSKKDIQYNLSKLNPTSSLAAKGNVTISFKGGSGGFYSHGKSLPHPLLNYQKKSPSKNILIPTSNAAATLASLGFPSPFHPALTDHVNHWVSAKPRDKTAKHVKTTPIATSSSVATAEERSSIMNQTPIKQSVEQNVEQSSHTKTVTVSNHTVTENSPTTINTSLPSKQENGSTVAAAKSGNKIIVQSMQLLPPNSAAQNAPLTPMSQKNNVFILPKSSGVLNLGQKITIPKRMLDTSAAAVPAVTSPPKVIVQTMPNPYSSSTSTETTPQLDLNTVWKKACGTFMGGADENSLPKMTAQSSVDAHAQGQHAIPPDSRKVVVKQSPSITIPCDGVSGRKITISTSQLVPFTGTLNASSTLKGTASVTVGNKKIKISTEDEPADDGTGSSTIRSGKSFTDWENELDRSNATRVMNNTITDSKTDKPATNSQTTQNADEKVKVDLSESRNNSTSTGGNTFQNTFDSHLSSTQTASTESEMSHNEYDFISLERDDDSSVTDSADAEDDLDDAPSQIEDEFESIEEDNIEEEQPAVEVEMETDAIIVEEEPANYDYLIEEVPEDEQFVEEEDADDDGLVEYISVGYGTTSELVAELESGTSSAQQNVNEKHRPANGVTQEELPAEIDYDQSTGGFETAVDNGIECDLLEMDTDGKYHARPYSYKQVMVEAMDSSSPKASKQMQPAVRLS